MGRCVLWGRARARARELTDRGAAAVEFALIMPILLLLVFGIISYGYMLSFRQAISQAAAEGARAAAVAQRDADQVPDAVAAMNEALDSYGVTCDDGTLNRDGGAVGTCAVAVATCAGEAASVQCVTVTIDYAYDDNPLLPVPGVGIVLPDNLRYSAVARVS
jgi:Flp pilus assembly protein TadG